MKTQIEDSKLLKRITEFCVWLQNAGAKIQSKSVDNDNEILRFSDHKEVFVIYNNNKHKLSFSSDRCFFAYDSFVRGKYFTFYIEEKTSMKTYEQLMQHYWGVIVPMAEAAGINPWECVRYRYGTLKTHPEFKSESNCYTFSLTVLEKRPVFVGDKLYDKEAYYELLTVEGINENNTLIATDSTGRKIDEWVTWYEDASWNPPAPPTKKRTFMLNSVELPCPDKNKGGYQIALISSKHFFSDFHDAQKVANAIDEILTTARDKE